MVMVWWWWCGGGWSGQTGGGDYLAGNLLDVIKVSTPIFFNFKF